MKISGLAIAFLHFASGHDLRVQSGTKAVRGGGHGNNGGGHQGGTGTRADGRPPVQEKKICGALDLRNAQCYRESEPEVYDASKAVVSLVKSTGDGWQSVCTGWLVGPNNYLMTNNHCIKTQQEASATSFRFMFESPGGSCQQGGVDDEDAEPEMVIQGGQLIWTSAVLDATLVKLEQSPVCEYGYFDIASEAPAVGRAIYVPQHPDGRDKSIGIFDTNSNSGFCEVLRFDENDEDYHNFIYTCDTEGGSSGSPVVDKTNPYTVIGLHKAGYNTECHGNIATPMSEIFPHVNAIVYNGNYYDQHCSGDDDE